MGNGGLRTLQKVRACRAAPQNLLNFAFACKKAKKEPKDLANFKTGRQVRTAHRSGVAKVQIKEGILTVT